MKKGLIIPLILLFFCACTNQSYGILPYQEKDIEAEINVNNEFKIRLIKKDNITLEIIEPVTLKEISFTVEENGILAKDGNVEIMLDKDKLDGIYAISRIFSLDEACLTTAENSQFSFEQNNAHYVVMLGKNDLPQSIRITSNSFFYQITIEGINISY